MSMEKCPVCGNLVFTNDIRAKSDEMFREENERWTMGDALEVLADIRRWACETLDASDAGKLCGMLAEVSRHANGLESQNAKLRELVRDLYRCDDESCTHCKYWNQGDGFYCKLGVGWKARRLKELGIEVGDE